jgi:hypothetical protein
MAGKEKHAPVDDAMFSAMVAKALRAKAAEQARKSLEEAALAAKIDEVMKGKWQAAERIRATRDGAVSFPASGGVATLGAPGIAPGYGLLGGTVRTDPNWRRLPGPWEGEPEELSYTVGGLRVMLTRMSNGAWAAHIYWPRRAKDDPGKEVGRINVAAAVKASRDAVDGVRYVGSGGLMVDAEGVKHIILHMKFDDPTRGDRLPGDGTPDGREYRDWRYVDAEVRKFLKLVA